MGSHNSHDSLWHYRECDGWSGVSGTVCVAEVIAGTVSRKYNPVLPSDFVNYLCGSQGIGMAVYGGLYLAGKNHVYKFRCFVVIFIHIIALLPVLGQATAATDAADISHIVYIVDRYGSILSLYL